MLLLSGGGISLSAVYVALISNSNMEFCNAGVGFGGGVFIEESGASLFSTSIMCVSLGGSFDVFFNDPRISLMALVSGTALQKQVVGCSVQIQLFIWIAIR